MASKVQAPQFDDLSKLMDEDIVVEFKWNGKMRRSQLTSPSVKDTLKVRERVRGVMSDELDVNEKRKQKSIGLPQVAREGFRLREITEQITAQMIRLVVPQMKGKSTEQMVRFVRLLSGGVESPLALAARRLCGVDTIGSPDAPF